MKDKVVLGGGEFARVGRETSQGSKVHHFRFGSWDTPYEFVLQLKHIAPLPCYPSTQARPGSALKLGPSFKHATPFDCGKTFASIVG